MTIDSDGDRALVKPALEDVSEPRWGRAGALIVTAPILHKGPPRPGVRPRRALPAS